MEYAYQAFIWFAAGDGITMKQTNKIPTSRVGKAGSRDSKKRIKHSATAFYTFSLFPFLSE
jgi:hypothetical protein